MRTSYKSVSIFFFILFFFYSAGLAQEKEIRIKLIEIRGNRKIDRMTILSRLTLREGDLFSPEQIQNDVKRLYRMGFFDHISVESEGLEGGVALYFIVQERPFLLDIVYEGNENLDKDQLNEKLSVKTQTFLDPEAVGNYVEKIKEAYEAEAYYNTSVLPVTQLLPDNQAVLTLLIEEGDQAYIRKIGFDGNNAFDESDLKDEMETSTYFWLTSWVTESGRYKKEQLTFDRERIKDHYMNNGYFEIDVGEARVELSEDKEWFEITIPIVEGEIFRFGGMSYEGGGLFKIEVISSLAESKTGGTFNRSLLRSDVGRMVDLYGEKGYIYANIVPDLKPGREERTVDVFFRISEGELVRVREINIFGNNKTRDKVIRREIRVNEQEKINTKALRRSFQRLHNLNYFETINIVPTPIDSGWVDLDVDVQEKPTGTFSVGGGYSSEDKFVATVDVTMGNFLGKGQLVKLRAETGARRDTYSLTFREPYLFDQDISGTINLFNQIRDFGSYEEERIGGDLILGKPFGEFMRASTSYTFETLKVFNLDRNASGGISFDVPLQVIEQAALGETVTSSVGFTLTRDTRDFAFDPKSGSRNALSYEYAGTFLGGDNAYYKVVADTSRFFPLWWNHIFSVHGRFGFAEGLDGKTLPVGERFYVGGINTVRGFKFGKAGPVTLLGEIVGGNKQLFFNFEYLIPIVAEAQIKFLLFYDYGAAFDDHEAIARSGMREAAGYGIRWISPVGPLRLEQGYNLEPRPGESDKTLEFSIGSLF